MMLFFGSSVPATAAAEEAVEVLRRHRARTAVHEERQRRGARQLAPALLPCATRLLGVVALEASGSRAMRAEVVTARPPPREIRWRGRDLDTVVDDARRDRRIKNLPPERAARPLCRAAAHHHDAALHHAPPFVGPALSVWTRVS